MSDNQDYISHIHLHAQTIPYAREVASLEEAKAMLDQLR